MPDRQSAELAAAARRLVSGAIDKIPLLNSLGNWNFLIGFTLMITGLLMTMRWR